MQTYDVKLVSEVSKSYLCKRAADSLDIDIEKKSLHHLNITADLQSPYNIGVITGSSGSGKTTLAKHIFGSDCFKTVLDESKPVIEQFGDEFSYDECVNLLSGIGLTSVPCWIRPVYTLSTGQKARAEAAILMAKAGADVSVLDEWTSTVDRTVAKIMSHCIQKYARRQNKKIILCSCHNDIIDWINPDWVIDCNKKQYIDRRSMVGEFERTDRLRLDIAETDKHSWPFFSKYHYLNDKLPMGKNYFFGLFSGKDQIGFGCYNAYLPGYPNIFYSNRVVIHPDYVGLGIGIKFINETAKIMVRRGFKVRATFSSMPLYRSRVNDPLWRLREVRRDIKKPKKSLRQQKRKDKSISTYRNKVKIFCFDFIWNEDG